MFKSKLSRLVALGLLFVIVGISLIPKIPNEYCPDNRAGEDIKLAADIMGMDDILFTNVTRIANLSGYGIVYIEDYLEFQNNYENSINIIYIGISPHFSDNLIYHRAFKGNNSESLLIERTSYISNGYEMIAITLDAPLYPGQKANIKYVHSYRDLIEYVDLGKTDEQHLIFSGNVFPLLPYRALGEIKSWYYTPTQVEPDDSTWRLMDNVYNFTFFSYENYLIANDLPSQYLEPFMKNMGAEMNSSIKFYEMALSKLEISDMNREILISPWGMIKVTERFQLQNNGFITIDKIPLHIPKTAYEISLTDYLGEISKTNNGDGKIVINLISFGNRPKLTAGSSMSLIMSYYLPFEQYSSINWFQESIELNMLTSTFDFLVKGQTVNIRIDGCQKMDYCTITPDKVQKSQGAIINSYYSDFVSPFESKEILITFTINVLDLSIRPIIFMILIVMLCASFAVLSKRIKKRQGEDKLELIGAERLPVREIREYCSLCEEKNALIIEIRTMDDFLQRKKIPKKKYTSVVQTNTKKIEEINNEIIPFKNVLIETSLAFENIIRKIDVFDAERVSIDDSVNLLDARYKQGKLPSRAAYQKLADGFLKRRRKIDRNYDKLIQQLRSYLL
ncbi:MAG: hypothetical protein JW891_15445 [Candidatus Lokiarchaeota archaeon]|nr:hypothetical protein [Candidatus Lokiarchaeota archaeon]